MMKVKKIYLKQVDSIENPGTVAYEITKTVDAGTKFVIGNEVNPQEVDQMSINKKYSVTIV